jgi:SOS response regulatory protein OraA/RecX
MPVVTALRAAGRGRIAVELDGARWRTLPVEAVASAGLGVGTELDRPRARAVRRALRRSEAVSVAGRALRYRDLSAARLEQRLERARVAPAPRDEALAALARAGLVDDERFAHGRAAALAARGLGDAAIRYDLERERVGAELIESALAELRPETERAEWIVAARGRGPATARFLARRGFCEDAVEAAAEGIANDP